MAQTSPNEEIDEITRMQREQGRAARRRMTYGPGKEPGAWGAQTGAREAYGNGPTAKAGR